MGQKTVIPPVSVAKEAVKGLVLRRSLPPSRRCCTDVGIRRAVQLSNRQPVSLDTIKRMRSYFSRHEADRHGEGWGVDSKGWQAWLLWGGDSGRAWAKKILGEYTANGFMEKQLPPHVQKRMKALVDELNALEGEIEEAYERENWDKAELLEGRYELLADRFEGEVEAFQEGGDLDIHGAEAVPSLEEELSLLYNDYVLTLNGETPPGMRFIETPEELVRLVRSVWELVPGVTDDMIFEAAMDAWVERRGRLDSYKARKARPNPGVEMHFDPEILTEEQKQDLIDFDDPAWGMEDQVRRQQVVDRIVAAGPRAFIAPVSEASKVEVLVHKDSVHPGNWRATYIDEDGPIGHDEAIRPTPEESFRDIVNDLKYRANLYKMEWFTMDGFKRPKDWFKKNPMAPGYQSYAWTTQDWRVLIVKSGGKIDYSDKCGAPSNSLSGGRKRLCLPAPVIKRLVRSKSGKQILIEQARKKERAKPGVSVRWDPRIRDLWRELEQKTVEDR